MEKYSIRTDCRHFTGEKPCKFHKAEGVKCFECGRYAPAGKRILIIKLGAMGDVIRTTFILPALKKKFPDCHITWVTEKGSSGLLLNIDLLDLVIELTPDSLAYLSAVEFDIALSLDPSAEGAALAENIKAESKKGFGLDSSGKLYPFNKGAQEWHLTGIFDDLKKGNRKTYQEMASEAAELEGADSEVILNLSEEEKQFGRDFLEKKSIPEDRPVVGLNTGAGGRWKLKRWTEEGFLSLINLLGADGNASILLFGGPLEEERNRRLMKNAGARVFDTGTKNTPREFLSLINLCDVLVSGDTFAMHAAVGLKKKVAALFGPTSSAEIELYGRGEKIISPAECVCCYKADCSRKPDCMELIKPETVYNAVRRLTSL